MFKNILYVIGLAVGLSVLALFTGYVEYRSNMNQCLDAGGVVIKTSHGLKCVPRGEIKVI